MNQQELMSRYHHLWADGCPKEIQHGDGWNSYTAQICHLVSMLNEKGVVTRIRQIKEKLGAYTVYIEILNEVDLNMKQRELARAVQDIISIYWKLTQHVCDVCGKPGEIRNINSLLATRCNEHAEKRQYS